MDELTDYNPADAEGFIRVNALRLKQHAKRRWKIKNFELISVIKFIRELALPLLMYRVQTAGLRSGSFFTWGGPW